MSFIKVECAFCGRVVDKPSGEVRRNAKLERSNFCNLSCAAKWSNASRKKKEIVLACPVCDKPFVTTTKKRAKKFCSRGCASRGSVTKYRREKARETGLANKENLSVSGGLKTREAWKYALLKKVLKNRPHEFEFPLENRVFDLALLDTKVLVEFDGPYHSIKEIQEDDRKKDQIAEKYGFLVIRRRVDQAVVILPETLNGL